MPDPSMSSENVFARVKPGARADEIDALIARLEERRARVAGKVPTTRPPGSEGGGDG